MKRKLLFVMALVISAFSTVNAQTWTASDLAAGRYVFQNVGSGKFFGPANSWGSQASLIPSSHFLTLAKVSDGVYTIESQLSNGGNNKFFTGSFLDGAATNITINDNGSGIYTMSNGTTYYGYDGSADPAPVLASNLTNPDDANAQWKIVSFDDYLNDATKANPKDATYRILCANFDRNHRTRNAWSMEASNQNLDGGDNTNKCAESFHAVFTLSQVVNDMPNGLYTMTAQGFYRQDGSDNEHLPYFYINDEKGTFPLKAGSEGNMNDASNSFKNGSYTIDPVSCLVTDGKITVGAKLEENTNLWCIWDNFVLKYYGPAVGSEAQALTGEMEAGKWYYFDVAIDGNYDLTAGNLNNIVYTTDGKILIEDEATITDKFAQASELELKAGRYFVKSSSAQNLTVAAHSFSYELGEPSFSTPDGGYVKQSTFTVTFPNAVSNDPEAALALVSGSKATVNGNSVDLVAAENGFTFEIGEIAVASDYVVTIPAGIYGFAGQNMNKAISLTLHTPSVADGTYYLYDAANKLFLARGNNWGTEASVDIYGVPFNLKTDAAGSSSIEFVDWKGCYLFTTADGGIFTDNNSTGWTFEKDGDGYYLRDAQKKIYAAHSAGAFGEYVHVTEDKSAATVWTFMSKEEHDAIVNAYPTDNINNVITASSADLTVENFAADLTANYNEEDLTSLIGTAKFAGAVGDWTFSQVRGQNNQPAYGTDFMELWQATGTLTQTVSKENLLAGIYKVTVDGYERRKSKNDSNTLGQEGWMLVSTYLAANDQQVRFKDWYGVEGEPNNTGQAVTAFATGKLTNEVYVYLDGNTDLTITVKKPNYTPDCWAIFNNFTLTRYTQTSVNLEITKAHYATFVAPFDVAIPEGVTAYTVPGLEANGNTLILDEVKTTIPANTPVVLFSETEVKKEVAGKGVGTDPVSEGLLTGVFDFTDISGADKYVLQNQPEVDGVAFYAATDPTAAITVAPNRAYLYIPETAVVVGAKAIRFPGADATGINTINVLTSGKAEIFNAAGARIPSLQKGVNIIRTADGKTSKVLVK